MIVQVTKRVINNGIPFYSYLLSGCSFHELRISLRIGISTASKIEKYVVVFGLPCCQNVFPNLQKSSGNLLLWRLKGDLISRIA